MPDRNHEARFTPQRVQCMEVWEGNDCPDNAFEMPGLRIWLISRPHETARTGGDVCYLSLCASGRITRLLLVDVTDLIGTFATAVVCTFFAPTKILTMSIAGHPMPLIMHHGSHNWCEMASNTPELGLANLPLGVTLELFSVRR